MAEASATHSTGDCLVSTGGENERPTVGGEELELIVNARLGLAGLMRDFARLEQQLRNRPVTIDVQMCGGGGGGGGGGGSPEDVARKWKLAFSAVGPAAEMNQRVTSLRHEFDILAEAAEKANSAITIALSGERGRGGFQLKTKSDVASLMAMIAEQGPVLAPMHQQRLPAGVQGPLNRPTPSMLTARLGMGFDPEDPEARGALQRVEQNLGAMTDENTARRESVKTIRDSNKALDYWREAILSWGKGARPQRGMSEMITGFLHETAGMGQIPASLLGGTLGMIGGGAMFHIGWEITNQLAKLPTHIGELIQNNQRMDIMRASMLAETARPGTPASLYTKPFDAASADAEMLAKAGAGAALFRRLGGDEGAAFLKTFQGLQTESNKLYGDPEQRRIWMQRNARFAAMASFGHLFAGTGDSGQVAKALQDMQMENAEAGEGMATLVNQPGLKKWMIDREREKQHLGTAFSDAQVWDRMAPYITGAYGIGAANPELRAAARERVYNAFSGMIQNPSAMGQAQTAIQQWRWGPGFREWLETEWGSKEKLSDADWNYITTGATTLRRKRHGLPDLTGAAGPLINPDAYESSVSPERQRYLHPMRRAWQGDFAPFLGGVPQPFEGVPLGQPRFSFSSLSEFANKMQTEAGLQMLSHAEKTANASEKSAACLERIDQRMERQGVATW